MRLTEELMLILLDEQSGYIELVDSWDFSCVVAGSVIADLALDYRIDTDLEQLRVIDSKPTGDAILDPTLEEIVNEKETFDTQYWIEKNASRADDIVTVLLDRLVEKGILDYEVGGFWELSKSVALTHSYTVDDGTSVLNAKTRIMNAILNDEIPGPRDVLLISLLNSCNFLKLLMTHEEYEERNDRIEILANMDLIGQSIANSVQITSLLPRPRASHGTKQFKKIRVADIWREPAFRRGNVPQGMCALFRKYGPVVKAPMKMGGEPVFALMGPDVNQWVNKYGRLYLRTKDYIKDFEGVFGASRTMPGMDGAEHFRMRKSLRSAYSKTALTNRLPDLIHYSKESLSNWKQGDVSLAMNLMQELLSKQVGNLMINVDTTTFADELLAYKARALKVKVQRLIPEWTLSTPKMRRAKRHSEELVNMIKASHTPSQRKDQPLDIADAIIELHRQDPQFLPETDIAFPFVASMVASLYMASGISFALYAMLKDPKLFEQVSSEGEKLFGDNRLPTPDEFADENIDVTHRVFLEAERLYPVISSQLRNVINGCYVADYELEPHSRVIICQTATHYMEEFYPDPCKFDIDRFLPERQEHLSSPSVYAPYGLGTHHCLGHRYLELQSVVNLMLIAYHFRLELVPSSYEMKLNPFPNAHPRKMKIRVAEVKHRF